MSYLCEICNQRPCDLAVHVQQLEDTVADLQERLESLERLLVV